MGRCLTLVLRKKVGLCDQAQSKRFKIARCGKPEPFPPLIRHRVWGARRETKASKQGFGFIVASPQSDQPSLPSPGLKANGAYRLADVVAPCKAAHEFRPERSADGTTALPPAMCHAHRCRQMAVGGQNIVSEHHEGALDLQGVDGVDEARARTPPNPPSTPLLLRCGGRAAEQRYRRG